MTLQNISIYTNFILLVTNNNNPFEEKVHTVIHLKKTKQENIIYKSTKESQKPMEVQFPVLSKEQLSFDAMFFYSLGLALNIALLQ